MSKYIYKTLIFILLSSFATSLLGAESLLSSAKSRDVGLNNMEDIDFYKDKKVKDKPENRNQRNGKKISFETYDYNYERAMNYYNNGQYLSAARIFEELYPLSLGTPKADTILYKFANCYYQNQDYTMAAFHFKDYSRRYPGSEQAETAYFMSLKSIYNVSPLYSLDQTDTYFAIEEINSFITQYPHSKHIEECNQMLDDLNNKLAKKDFEILKLYYNTYSYAATQIMAKNFFKSHPYCPYMPEAIYILVQNNYKYAKNSVVAKQAERYQSCVDAYEMLAFNYPESTFLNDAKKLADESKKQIEKLKSSK